MTAPRFAPCRCAHSHDDHAVEGFAPQCTASGCTCLRYRPDTAAAPETTAAGPRTPKSPAPAAVPPMPEAGPDKPVRITVTELLRRGRDSELKPIVKLTERVDALLEDLRERVLAEIAAADLKAAIAELEEQLAVKKGQLQTVGKGKRTPPASGPKTGGDHQCPDCPDAFGTAQGLGAHRAHKHGYRAAKAG